MYQCRVELHPNEAPEEQQASKLRHADTLRCVYHLVAHTLNVLYISNRPQLLNPTNIIQSLYCALLSS
jgi:hypothetical protein